MTRTPQPTAQDIRDLVAFLPKLYADGFTPIKSVHSKDADGEIVAFPWPEYDQTVEDFLRVARRDCWIDRGYVPAEVAKLIESEEAIRQATLPQVRAMITYFVRGERFSDGHWGRMIEGGYVRRILERLAALEAEPDEGSGRSRR
ncbi:MAG: DUF6508 domain-containing protein [Alphaproteobacteria bacterium]|nr:DUF6508 domain-containing protein [Alphaproteobacteria bacterium]